MNGSITFKQKEKTFGVVGDLNEFNRVIDLLSEIGYKNSTVYHISPKKIISDNAIGNIDQLDQISYIYKLNEIIFCAKNNSAKEIITWMSTINNENIEFKIAQPDSSFLIGSNSINSSGDVYVLNINAISQEDKKKKKKTFGFIFRIALYNLFSFTYFTF